MDKPHQHPEQRPLCGQVVPTGNSWRTIKSPSGCAEEQSRLPEGIAPRTERRGRTTETLHSQTPPIRGPSYPAQTTVARRGSAPPTPREELRCYT
ncbi:unnamed protein product [Boreogadus saida]